MTAVPHTVYFTLFILVKAALYLLIGDRLYKYRRRLSRSLLLAPRCLFLWFRAEVILKYVDHFHCVSTGSLKSSNHASIVPMYILL